MWIDVAYHQSNHELIPMIASSLVSNSFTQRVTAHPHGTPWNPMGPHDTGFVFLLLVWTSEGQGMLAELLVTFL